MWQMGMLCARRARMSNTFQRWGPVKWMISGFTWRIACSALRYAGTSIASHENPVLIFLTGVWISRSGP